MVEEFLSSKYVAFFKFLQSPNHARDIHILNCGGLEHMCGSWCRRILSMAQKAFIIIQCADMFMCFHFELRRGDRDGGVSGRGGGILLRAD